MDLIYGSALWYASTKVNCHHLAERLAERTPVLFVESVGARTPRAHEWRRLVPRLLRVFRPLRRVGPGIWLYSPLPLPLYRGLGARVNSRWVGLQVRALLALKRWPVEVCWAFHPMGLGTLERLRCQGVVYYCVDDHAANPGVDPAAIRQMEEGLVRRANVAIATGEPLARRLRDAGGRVEVIPNVADTELFCADLSRATHPVLAAIDALPRPRLGYIGNLAAYKVDMELIFEVAQRRPGWSVVLAGPRNQGDVQEAIRVRGAPPNVHFVGEVPHRLAPAVIDRFDVALLPSAQHDVMSASFPLKFFEYLLRGKPIVARPLAALEPFRAWYVEADRAESFVRRVEEQLAADSPECAERRRVFARGYGWREKMGRLWELREEIVSGR